MNYILCILLSILTNTAKERAVQLNVSNPSTVARIAEVVETDYSKVCSSLRVKQGDKIVVLDKNGQQVPYQITHDGKLIFPATVEAESKTVYTVKEGKPQTFKTLVYGRFIAERKDDYAWENNVGAFRLYGPALKPIDGPSNGVDVWSKRTPDLIIDKWYKLNSEGKDYHSDRGEGQDCYKVGRTLGAGMPAPVLNDTLVLGENFIGWETLDNGPLRTTVRLTYSPLKVGGNEVTEIREISLDANTPFCKTTVSYQGASQPLSVAAGITLHTNQGIKESLAEQGAVLYWEKQEKEFGTIGTAVIFPRASFVEAKEINNHLCALSILKPQKSMVYYFGAGYDKFLHPSLEAWRKAVVEQSARVNQPITVTIVK